MNIPDIKNFNEILPKPSEVRAEIEAKERREKDSLRQLLQRETMYHDIAKTAKKKLERKVMDLTKEVMTLKGENEKLERLVIALLRENEMGAVESHG